MGRKPKAAASFTVVDQSIESYLKSISNTKALSREEEQELAKRIRKGDQKAIETLVKANLRFVVSVARNYSNQGVPIADLINEGNLGLIRAASRFDGNKNFKFISYAVWWIRQAILQALADNSRFARIPVNKVGTIYKIGKTQSKLEQRYSRTPDLGEVARELNLDERQVRSAASISGRHVSLDAPMQQTQSAKLMDVLEDKNSPSPENDAHAISLHRQVSQSLHTLNGPERQVVRLYFGLDTEVSLTLDEIGERLSLTRERVRQIKVRALEKLAESPRLEELRSAWVEHRAA